MKAKKKPLEKLTVEDLGVDLTPRLETIKVSEPPKRVGGQKVCFLRLATLGSNKAYICHLQVTTVDELVAKLKEAGITAV
jgi:electron transfer flavoprotein beta subunit